MLEVCTRMNELLDVVVVHYYHALDSNEEHEYRRLLNQVFDRHDLTDEERARIVVLQREQAAASRTGTQVNQDRKGRISVVITEFERVKVMIDLYRGVLLTFQRFVKELQHEKPMVHLLHVEMVALVRELLSKFMTPKTIPLSHKELLKVDVRNRDLQLSNKRLSVGQFCYSALNKARVERKVWVKHIYDSLREGYMKSAEFLQKNLPLDNSILTSLSALTPALIQSDAVVGAFTTIGEALPNVVPPEEIGQLVEECRAYQMDADMLLHLPSYIEGDCRVDVDWWSHVVSLRNAERDVRYPTLGKLVKAVLSIFTGPLVEGSFNLMDDLLESDRCSMNVETYESLTVIKSTLKARDWTASTMNIDQPLRRSCLSSFLNYQLHLKKKKETTQALKQKRLNEAARMLSSKEANKLAQQARKIKRPAKSSSAQASISSAQASTSSAHKALLKKTTPALLCGSHLLYSSNHLLCSQGPPKKENTTPACTSLHLLCSQGPPEKEKTTPACTSHHLLCSTGPPEKQATPALLCGSHLLCSSNHLLSSTGPPKKETTTPACTSLHLLCSTGPPEKQATPALLCVLCSRLHLLCSSLFCTSLLCTNHHLLYSSLLLLWSTGPGKQTPPTFLYASLPIICTNIFFSSFLSIQGFIKQKESF
ncbi:uncharacterized protein LOC132892503 [Neoarius graeffei]|uniref:uncharacterized protein LOC132892503 n=1 Tax=Neoarius graeffei TaxID=443677 RepID=UPI00298C457A|nr:uncharacterized protein LOC132892503 [Neoarius graeffei]